MKKWPQHTGMDLFRQPQLRQRDAAHNKWGLGKPCGKKRYTFFGLVGQCYNREGAAHR